ncbi:MAG TPA: ABC-type transport auxiliary lipoprotein family protein [Candidatus Eremiobacteraceae bacterium]|nr:ABC-type transport auxiliary lipoprotein family protein [Candidatus Eremiobacteraceae bacterium]
MNIDCLDARAKLSARSGASKFFRSLAGLAALALCAGCGSSRPIKYYQITYPTNSFVAQDAIDATLVVTPFEASHLYLDNRIVYGFDSPEMGTYQYQRWADPPIEMLQNALVRGLRSSGRFKGVYTGRTSSATQFILGGRLYDFREIDGPAIMARLRFDIVMRDRKSGAVVWTHSYSYDEPVPEKTVVAVATAMDKNVQRSIQEIEAGLTDYFRVHPAQ